MSFTYYEFFAGTGMARAGLGDDWLCQFANDNDVRKLASYRANWGGTEFDARDIAEVSVDDLRGTVDLAWASFPCQDLSQAGSKLGLGTACRDALTRSGALWPFLRLIGELSECRRQPRIIALENVVGLLNSNGGEGFRAICAALSSAGYRYGAVIVDASHFVPQSRPRVFLVAVRRNASIPPSLEADEPSPPWHPPILRRAWQTLEGNSATDWIWWNLGVPPRERPLDLSDILDVGERTDWDDQAATSRLIGMMTTSQLDRLETARRAERPMIGSLYLRMRPDATGRNVQRAEISFGETLGCLRTPKGGASRPRIVVVGPEGVRTRLVTTREAASLMGLDKTFVLPTQYHDAFRLIGDGVAPPVVRFLADRLFEPLCLERTSSTNVRELADAIA